MSEERRCSLRRCSLCVRVRGLFCCRVRVRLTCWSFDMSEELLGARKKAKADMKKEKAKGKDMDAFKYAVFDGRQLALKVQFI